MYRRDFIKVVGLAGCSVLVSGGNGYHNLLFAGEKDKNNSDVRFSLLQVAMTAPSSHNTQPWLVDLSETGKVYFYIDKERLLLETDPYTRQIHISQGCFIEAFCLAAAKKGFDTHVFYFPDGEYGVTELPDKPVACVDLRHNNSKTPDPLASLLEDRQTNKREYNKQRLTNDSIRIIEANLKSGSLVKWINGDLDIAVNAELLTEAMEIEVKSVKRNRELLNWFRFNEEEMRKSKDGFGIGSSGASGFKKWMIESFFLDREKAVDPGGSFVKSSITMTKKQAESAGSLALMISEENTRQSQLNIGRDFLRLQLTAQALNLCVHPLNQITQEYAEMAALRKTFRDNNNVQNNHIVQMVLRLGVASRVESTLRRNVEDIVV